MQFPNIFQTALLVFFLIIIHWILNHTVTFPKYESLKTLVISLSKIFLLLGTILILLKQGLIKKCYVNLKRPRLDLSVVSVTITLLIVFNPIIGSVSLFSQKDITSYVESILIQRNDFLVFLNLVIVIPIFEELLFRGIIFNGLKNNYSPFIGLFVSSVLFGIFHIDILGSTVMGVWLCWVMHKTNNVTLCILAHSACNLLSFLLRIIVKDTQGRNFFTYIGENAIVISIIMFLLVIGVFYISIKKFDSASPASEKQNES